MCYIKISTYFFPTHFVLPYSCSAVCFFHLIINSLNRLFPLSYDKPWALSNVCWFSLDDQIYKHAIFSSRNQTLQRTYLEFAILVSEGFKIFTYTYDLFSRKFSNRHWKEHEPYLKDKQMTQDALQTTLSSRKKHLTNSTSIFPHSSGGSWCMAIWYLTYKEKDWLKDDLNSGSSKETGTNLTFRARKIQANAIETTLPNDMLLKVRLEYDLRKSTSKAQCWNLSWKKEILEELTGT